MTVSASINGQSFILGEVRADPADLRGEGGPVSPVLVLPLTVALNPQPAERTLVVTELWGSPTPGRRRTGRAGRATACPRN